MLTVTTLEKIVWNIKVSARVVIRHITVFCVQFLTIGN
jgi:hypothetical protein